MSGKRGDSIIFLRAVGPRGGLGVKVFLSENQCEDEESRIQFRLITRDPDGNEVDAKLSDGKTAEFFLPEKGNEFSEGYRELIHKINDRLGDIAIARAARRVCSLET